MSLLFTDLYELTMAQGYWVHGRAEEEAVFHLAYRDAPPEAACVLACGLEPLLRWLEDFAPTADDLSYLASLTAPDGTRLFQAGFLDALASLQFTADVDAVPEGTAVFPGGPLLRVQGPLMQAQMIETAALNLLGYASLVMTQAAQVCAAAQGDPVLEFGLRRAQGPDGGHTASRAAYLGGCTATSNLVAAQRWNIPVRGTHAHSWVMSFDDEQDAFAAYLASAPNNSILLVDTYDVATGLDRAIAAGQQLTARGGEFSGVRLDSGDLGHWARVARQKLDAAGFAATRIVASGGINAREVRSLKQDGAPIDIWGVGTWLVTGGETAALDTTYKLGAIRRSARDPWSPRMKRSASPRKRSLPGLPQILRTTRDGAAVGDVVYSIDDPTPEAPRDHEAEPLLVPQMRGGRRVATAPGTEQIRQHAARQAPLLQTAEYPVSHDPALRETISRLCAAAEP